MSCEPLFSTGQLAPAMYLAHVFVGMGGHHQPRLLVGSADSARSQLEERLHHAFVSRAPTDGAGKHGSDLGLGGSWMGAEELGCGDKHSRCAEAALDGEIAGERGPHGLKLVGETDHRFDLGAVNLNRERATGSRRDAVEHDGATAAHALLTSDPDGRDAEVFTQMVGETEPRLDRAAYHAAIDSEVDLPLLRVWRHWLSHALWSPLTAFIALPRALERSSIVRAQR